MISFPNAKINLGLNVLRKRDDGYHDIESVFYPVHWRDILEVIPSGESGIQSSYSGLSIPGDEASNLCLKAYQLLKENHDLPGIKMHLHKIIPMGAGLGGGSADGAFMLSMLNALFALGLSDETLENYASRLGSDCPFFIRNRPAAVSGRGEIMRAIDVDLSDYRILLINPGLHLGTAEAYRGITPSIPTISAEKVILEYPITEWKNYLKNDFEKPAFARFPQLNSIKEDLYHNEALYASMTGSGSTMYGIFKAIPTSLVEKYNKENFAVKSC